jgi:RimJ/RimL family protein N-acetyltransferase
MTDETSTIQFARPILNLIGEHVALGPLHEGMIPLMTVWDNDFSTSAISGDDLKPYAPSAVSVAVESLMSGGRDGWYGFAIYERATFRPIGHVNLRDVTTVHGTAEIGVLIGERDCRGKGYGTEVVRLILDFAFNGLNLHNVWLDTLSLNPSAVAAYQRAGFREIGRRREAYRIGGQLYDVILMDCLAREFARPDVPGWGMSGVLGQ